MVIGIAVFISIMAGVLGGPSASKAAYLYSIPHDFGIVAKDGVNPYYGSLTLSGSTLYGMTSGGGAYNQKNGGNGTIFKINTDGSDYKVLYSFGSVKNDGACPMGSLTLSGSTLYGMTSGGGAYNQKKGGNGTIFKINTDGSDYKVLYSFGSVTNDGAYPMGSLTLSGSTLYGMTASGGACNKKNGGNGTIFKINTDGADYKVLYSFGSVKNDGAYPEADLTLSGSTLYGMTTAGGSSSANIFGSAGDGTIFKIDTNGAGYQVLYRFSNYPKGGACPFGSLTLSGSTLYGMAYAGGADYDQKSGGIGAIFKINTDGTGHEVLYDFGSVANDGAYPISSLTLSASTLYGMTMKGGAYNRNTGGRGTIFKINTDGADYKVLYSFGSVTNDGAYPSGSPALSGYTLYGMTHEGGAYNQKSGGDGIIFSLNTFPSGSLKVTISPPAAVSAGAKWKVDEGSWQSSGHVVQNLSVGTHTVAFNNISSWITPAGQPVSIKNGQTAPATGTYVTFTGTWQGSWASYYSESYGSGSLSANITQSGTTLTGELSVSGTSCGSFQNQLSGTVSGNTATINASDSCNGTPVRLEYTTGVISGNEFSGTWTLYVYVNGDWDYHDSGTFSLSRD
jgi:uncharacterized repeat protein (TIGR03803 family)